MAYPLEENIPLRKGPYPSEENVEIGKKFLIKKIQTLDQPMHQLVHSIHLEHKFLIVDEQIVKGELMVDSIKFRKY